MKYIHRSSLLLIIGLCFLSCESKVTQGAKQDIGIQVYNRLCVSCHGPNGDLKANGAADLSESALDLEGRIQVINQGRKLMMPYKSMLSKEEIDAVARYTMRLDK